MSGYLVQIGATTGRLKSISGMGFNYSGSGVAGRSISYGAQYIFPTSDQLKAFRDLGFNCVRLPLKWERLQPVLSAALSSTEMGYLIETLEIAARLNIGVIPEIHNSAAYNIGTDAAQNHQLIGSASVSNADFADLWTRVAATIKDHPALIGYDLMNEPKYASNPERWPIAAQAAVDAIRAVDTRNLIFVEGDGYSSAALWTTFNNDLSITDSANKLIYSAHSWWDSDQSGNYVKTYAQELALDSDLPTRGSKAIKVFADWCALKGVRGQIGEVGWPPNDSDWDAVGSTAIAYAATRGLPCMYWAMGGVNGSSTQVLVTPETSQINVMKAKNPTLPRLLT